MDDIRILALDDDPFIRRILQDVFTHNPSFRTVGSAKAFHEMYDEFKPDILLLDVELGDGNGIDICRSLRANLDKESLFIVILTAYDNADSIEQAYQAGANDYIRKPFLPYEILAKVQQMSKIIQYQKSILDLYNRQRQFNQRLYRLGKIINKSINYTRTKDLLESIEHISTVIPVDSMELLLEGKLIFSKVFTEGFNHVPFASLEHKIPLDNGKRLIRMRQPAGDEPVNIVVARVIYNKNKNGFLLLESRQPTRKENMDMLAMYLDFINIMGIELHAREMLSSEVSRDRRELAKVRSIQVSLLPHFSDVDKFDIASTFIPMDEISGDFFDGFYLDEDNYQLVLCDVSGHGMASSYVGSSIRGILRSFAKENTTPQHIVESLNVEMVKNLAEIYYFSTLVLCQLNVRTGIMHIVSAGHPPCFYYDAMKDEFTRIMNTGPLVGLIPTARFDVETIELKMGDCFFMYTDGIVEAPSELGGEMYGEDRLFEFFKSNITRPSMDIVHTLLGTVYEYTGYQSMQDDVTVICIKRIG